MCYRDNALILPHANGVAVCALAELRPRAMLGCRFRVREVRMAFGMVGDVWKTINEFMKRITALEVDNDDVKKDTQHLRKDLKTIQKRLSLNDKIEDDLKAKLADHESRIRELEKRNHGLAISAGKAKAKVARLESNAKH